jgi:hypothetical protein
MSPEADPPTRRNFLVADNTRRFPILGVGESIPWSILAPHEAQAQRNHQQSLERLASRGGLAWAEALSVLTDQRRR